MIKVHFPTGNQTKSHSGEWLARGLAILLFTSILLASFFLRPGVTTSPSGGPIEIHARMPEVGGWSLSSLSVTVGQPLYLRLVSDDVTHSFKIGKSDQPALELLPGKPVETWLTFDEPGIYTFYCTRWCGPNHWRMRGNIEVLPRPGETTRMSKPASPPRYLSMGLNIDAPHPAQVIPSSIPSALEGIALGIDLPQAFLSDTFYWTHSPEGTWKTLRLDPLTSNLDDQDVWDLVALIWYKNTTPQAIENGRELYAQNCAACHGEDGNGEGVFASGLGSGEASSQPDPGLPGYNLKSPADFTDASSLLGASPALLQGKIIRGGMGTGMPYWGSIFTEEQVWSLVDTLYQFQFNLEVKP